MLQLEIGTAQRLFRRQECQRRAAAGNIFLDLIGRSELETICLVSMQARQVDFIVARDLRDRPAGGEATVDFRASEMLARGARSAHGHNKTWERYSSVNLNEMLKIL